MTRTEKKSWMRFAGPLVAGGLLVVAGLNLTGAVAASNSAHGESQRIVSKLQAQIDGLTSQRDAANNAAIAISAGAPIGDTGAVVERLATDRSTMKDFLTMVFTWKSDATYAAARDAVVAQYKVAESSDFLTQFFPPAPVSIDADGNEYPYIDAAGLNSRLAGFTVYPIEVLGTQYTYVVIAVVETSSSDGSTRASREVVLKIISEADGSLSSIVGWAASTQARTSATG